LRFSVLASGSSGNASLVEADGFGVLLDAGLGPRLLGARLKAIDRDWSNVHAMVLTHTHGDHWKERTFTSMLRLGIPLYCHADHHLPLRQASIAFADLRAANLVRSYDPGQSLALSPTLSCTPFPVWHDETTCGFRFEAAANKFGEPSTLAYAADLGSWQSHVVDSLANADILALEFNHDEIMERTSRRSPALIFRVLGDRGHLSNSQAADLLREVLKRSRPGLPRHLVQLHMSRHCNRPNMAVDAARVVLEELQAEVEIHTAQQNIAGPMLTIGKAKRHLQPLLPGWDQV
jgi:phosphoribosyl 1,2-cyclic phosphodiesterase